MADNGLDLLEWHFLTSPPKRWVRLRELPCELPRPALTARSSLFAVTESEKHRSVVCHLQLRKVKLKRVKLLTQLLNQRRGQQDPLDHCSLAQRTRVWPGDLA